MSDNNRISLWGPPVDPNTNASSQNNNLYGSVAPASGMLDSNQSYLPQTKKVKFGVLDAVIGFVLMIFLQAIVAAAAIAIVIAQNVSQGANIEDVDALTEKILLDLTTSGPFLLIAALSMYLAWWVVARFSSKKRGIGSYAKDFWMKIKWKRDLAIGVAFAVGFRLLERGVIFVLTSLGVDMSSAGNADTVTSMPGIWLVINAFLIAGVIGPFFEEFFFRGLFMQGLIRTFSRRRKRNQGQPTWASKHKAMLAAVISSIIFGFMHFQGTNDFNSWMVVTQTGILGFALAMITLKTKRLGGAIIGHILFNLSGVILVVLLGS